jgi:hypothetical protein
MAPQVKKAKTAFMFYQADQLAKIRAELGGPAGCSMGEAMTEVSSRKETLLYCERMLYPTLTFNAALPCKAMLMRQQQR